MRCPRCRLADLTTDTGVCVVCGYVVPEAAAAAPVADATASGATELDARRELAGTFRLDALLARRPSAVVYLACDKAARTVLVTAVVRSATPGGQAEEGFRSVAEAAGALEHPHIVSLCGWGETPRFLWYAMQHVEGRTVAEVLKMDGPLDVAAARHLLEQVGGALDYAHRLGVCHGDLNAARVIVDATGAARVSDFAVAAAVAGRVATPEGDQRALAALVYETLSGTAPPARAAPALRALQPEVPVFLSDAVEQALRERPGERFPSVREFVAAAGGAVRTLDTRWLAQPPPSRPSPNYQPVIMDFESEPRRFSLRMAAGAVVLAAGLGGLWFATATARGERSQPPPARAATNGVPDTERIATSLPGPAVPSAAPGSLTVVAPPAAPLAAPAADSARPARLSIRTSQGPRPLRRPIATSPRASEPGRLSINALPWGTVSVDGRAVGHTPVIGLAVAPGSHRVRVVRDGFEPVERTVRLAPGDTVRITDIVLRERTP